MRTLIFAKRNLKEILRDPLSLIFNFVFPLVLLLVFFFFIFGKTTEQILQQTPMFAPNRIVPAITVFGFSFLTLFAGLLVSNDRESSFTARLKTSPIKPHEFFFGYLIPMLIIAFIQIITVFVIGYLLSFLVKAEELRFNLFSVNILLTIVFDLLISVIFIAFGILFGCITNSKSVGGVSSIIINVSSIFGGVFMPLPIMGVFKYIAQCLPFYHTIAFIQDVSNGDWPASIAFYQQSIDAYKAAGMDAIYNTLDFYWVHIIFIVATLIITILLAVFTFKKKLQSDK